ncbi:MAG: hypothetical protein RLY31_2073 [Bacteroidota bacterium]
MTVGSLAGIGGASLFSACRNQQQSGTVGAVAGERPLVLSTWDFGREANASAWQVLGTGGRALDAVEQGVRLVEEDASNQSVGIGGLPDREGRVTLDACIMDEKGRAGSVSALEDILHPVSVARAVMEKTPHVMLVGEGARMFALSEGFEPVDLLTEQSRQDWEKWKEDARYAPKINAELHDTIGMIALDKEGNLSGCCTTSGLAYKMRGRVGDSPIIGAGLYVDNMVGAATATGLGEVVLRSLGSFLIVELMRQGQSPQEACEEAIRRIIAREQDVSGLQVGFIALDKQGRIGGCSIQSGFNYAVRSFTRDQIVQAPHLI